MSNNDRHRLQILPTTRFVFSQDPDGTVYIGPRRGRKMRGGVTVNDLSSAPPPIPPIDCSNPITLNAILHLKNFDLLPVPITLLDLTAGQFNTRTPFELHLNYKPIHGEYVEIGTPHFEDWPEWQQPTKQTLDKLVKRVETKINK